MKKLLVILFLFVSIKSAATVYYMDTAGVNEAGQDGSIGEPWLTLAYAESRCSSGDTIHVNAGSYTISAIVNIDPGISIVGDGATSIFICNYAADFNIYLVSSTEGTDGNQSISNLKFDGNSLTGYGAILVYKRDSVLIHDCTFENIKVCAVRFKGNTGVTEPTTYATGNKFYDNIVTDCGGWLNGTRTTGGSGHGCLELGGQDGTLIYGNDIQNVGRDDDDAGYCIKSMGLDYLKNVKIYNNNIEREPYAGLTWDFAIELGRVEGGVEIYDNTIFGSVDFNDSYKGAESYSVWVHDNTIGQLVPSTYGTSPDGVYQATTGIYFERVTQNAIVERNLIRNVVRGVYMRLNGSYTTNEVRISYNLFYNINKTLNAAAGTEATALSWSIGSTDTFTNLDVWNNTILATYGNINATRGLTLPTAGTISNFSIRNNIISNFYNAPVYGNKSGSAIDVLSIENNIFYNNGHSNTVYLVGTAPTNYTNQNNLTSNPLIIGGSPFNFDIGSESPAINAGLDVGLTTDYVDSTIVGLPDMGAYEYYDDDPPVDPVVLTTTSPYWTGTTTATSGGNVISDGGGTVSQKGVCWNTAGTPTTADDKTEEGAGAGAFSSAMTGLTRGLKYYVRAYATNETGTSYGAEMTFRRQVLHSGGKALFSGGKVLIID